MNLTIEKLDEIRSDCLFADSTEIDPGAMGIRVDGPIHSVLFIADGVERHHEEIHELLNELPDMYHAGKGGGGSLIEAFHDRHGNIWAPNIMYVEELMLLGIASGWMKELFFGLSTRTNPNGYICHYCVSRERVPVEKAKFGDLYRPQDDKILSDEDDKKKTVIMSGGTPS